MIIVIVYYKDVAGSSTHALAVAFDDADVDEHLEGLP